MTKHISGIVLSLCVTAVCAQPTVARTIEDCAALTNPDDRLSCFDALLVERNPPPARAGQWRVTDERSALDDSRRVVLAVQSEEPTSSRFGHTGRASFLIRCEENTTSTWIHWGGHFMSDINNGGRVDYRIDQRPPDRITMRVSNNNESLGLWRGNQSIPFLRQILEADRLYVRATPFSESRVEATFVISGLSEAIKPLRETCNW